MLRLRSRLYIEPGEMHVLAEVAGREGRRLRGVGGSGLPGGLTLELLSAALVELLAGANPTLYVLGPATKRQARSVARRIAGEVRERVALYGREGRALRLAG